MKQQGNKCTLIGYKKQGHGFFNYSKSPKYFKKTLTKTEDFLEENNLLTGESWLREYCKGFDKNSSSIYSSDGSKSSDESKISATF